MIEYTITHTFDQFRLIFSNRKGQKSNMYSGHFSLCTKIRANCIELNIKLCKYRKYETEKRSYLVCSTGRKGPTNSFNEHLNYCPPSHLPSLRVGGENKGIAKNLLPWFLVFKVG